MTGYRELAETLEEVAALRGRLDKVERLARDFSFTSMTGLLNHGDYNGMD